MGSLEALGYEGVLVYQEGTRGWEERGRTLVGGPDPG